MCLKNMLIWPFVKRGKVVTKVVRNSNKKNGFIKKEQSCYFYLKFSWFVCSQ